ncbi:hypothetical protein FACS1894151_05500 [Spirochaetia bacterium]|nr:hypothetical protein FACS1894151_05500 [Spirochaetia bacterium]
MGYSQLYEIKDWGPVISRLILSAGKKLTAAPLDPALFSVTVKRSDPRVSQADIAREVFLPEAKRQVKAAYISDAQGNKADSGSHITLELASSPDTPQASPMNYYNGRNVWLECTHSIVYHGKKGGAVGDTEGVEFNIIDEKAEKTYRPQLEKFNLNGKLSYTDQEYGKLTLTYADYRPAGAHSLSALPLIIWLHGFGEGGTDPSITIAANKACNFASPHIQHLFGGEAFVLVPQSPTFWMDIDVLDPRDPRDHAFGSVNTSKYTRVLKNLIDVYLEENPGIDRRCIYVGGASNGGFMTQVLIQEYPDFFAAAFPVCSAAQDSRVTDKQIKSIRHLPIWFVNAASDPVVSPSKNSFATYERLCQLGAPHVHYSLPKEVVDKSGKYAGKNGQSYVYSGHASWIYVYNNDLYEEFDGEKVGILEWLARQRKK